MSINDLATFCQENDVSISIQPITRNSSMLVMRKGNFVNSGVIIPNIHTDDAVSIILKDIYKSIVEIDKES